MRAPMLVASVARRHHEAVAARAELVPEVVRADKVRVERVRAGKARRVEPALDRDVVGGVGGTL